MEQIVLELEPKTFTGSLSPKILMPGAEVQNWNSGSTALIASTTQFTISNEL